MAYAKSTEGGLYGVMAEFDDSDLLLEAGRRAYEAGYRRMDAYSPLPIDGLAAAIGRKTYLLPYLVLGGGITGALGTFFMQYFANVIHYPINIGGRPLNSWPSFFIPSFEIMILLSAATAVGGMIILNGLPMPYHPVFNAPNFQLATKDRFFLCIEARDKQFNLEETKSFLASLHPLNVVEVDKGASDADMASDFDLFS